MKRKTRWLCLLVILACCALVAARGFADPGTQAITLRQTAAEHRPTNPAIEVSLSRSEAASPLETQVTIKNLKETFYEVQITEPDGNEIGCSHLTTDILHCILSPKGTIVRNVTFSAGSETVMDIRVSRDSWISRFANAADAVLIGIYGSHLDALVVDKLLGLMGGTAGVAAGKAAQGDWVGLILTIVDWFTDFDNCYDFVHTLVLMGITKGFDIGALHDHAQAIGLAKRLWIMSHVLYDTFTAPLTDQVFVFIAADSEPECYATPEILLDHPAPGTRFEASELVVSGMVVDRVGDPNHPLEVTVAVGPEVESTVNVGTSGSFDKAVLLSKGINVISVKAVNRGLQNESQVSVAVLHSDEPSASTVLVIDTSGSMAYDDRSGAKKLPAAKRAARQFVHMVETENSVFATDHRVGLVSFKGNAKKESPITDDLNGVIGKINALSALDGTNMYAGLSIANNMLETATGIPIIILLSDGVPTAGPPPGGDYVEHEEAVLAGPVTEAANRGYCIYAVGFGVPGETIMGVPSIDPEFLNRVVRATGCDTEYHQASEAFKLMNVFVRMRHASMNRTEAATFEGTIEAGEVVPLPGLSVPPDQKALYANVTWPGSQLDLLLVDPQGRQVTDTYSGATIATFDNMIYAIVQDPAPGTWQVSVYGREVPTGGTQFAFIASVEPAEVEPEPEEPEPEEPEPPEPQLGILRVESAGPIDLALKDPVGRIVSADLPSADGFMYEESPQGDLILVSERVVGDYEIRVLAEPGADRLDRFDVTVTDGFDTVTLAERKFIIHAPDEPYVIRCTEEGFHDATGLPEEPKPEKKPNNGVGPSPLTIILIAVGGVALIGGILGLLYFLRSRYYI